MTYTPTIASGSTDGLPIKISGTGSGSANTLHTADASAIDEISVWASNHHSAAVELTLGADNMTDPDDIWNQSIPADDGLFFCGTIRLTNSKALKAFAGTTDVINVIVEVNRIS